MWSPLADPWRPPSASAAANNADAHAEDDPFDLPPLGGGAHGFPSAAPAPTSGAFGFRSFPMEDGDSDDASDRRSVHSDEFVDAEAFMADHRPGDDSFLREATEMNGDAVWSDDDEYDGDASMNGDTQGRRASAIFVPKSRNMEQVEFSSPTHSMRKSVAVHYETPRKGNARTSGLHGVHNAMLFSTTNTTQSSETEIHVDNRSMLTPNSFKYLQQRERLPTDDFTLSPSANDDSVGVSHSVEANQTVDAKAKALTGMPSVPPSPARPGSTEKALHAGPGVIKKALHEIESMLRPMELDNTESDPEFGLSLVNLKSRTTWPFPRDADSNAVADTAKYVNNYSAGGDDAHQQVTKPEMKNEGVQAEWNSTADVGVQAFSGTQPNEGKPSQSVANATRSDTRDVSMIAEDTGAMRISSLQLQGARAHLTETMKQDDSKSAGVIGSSHSVKQAPTAQSSTEDRERMPPFQEHRSTDFRKKSLPREAPIKTSSMETRDRISHFQESPSTVLHSKTPARPREHRPETSFRRSSIRQSLDAAQRPVDVLERENRDVNASARVEQARVSKRADAVVGGNQHEQERESIKASLNSLPLATAVPSQMARRCRRFLCTVGERMTEQIVFSNGSSKVGRICVSLLPLSTGCQQFSVSPAVLELQPHSRSAFTVTFSANHPGVVAGIFQFRAVGVDGLFEPYEVLIEASVRGDLQLSPGLPRPKSPKPTSRTIKSAARETQVTELPAQALAGVNITPTFLRYAKTRDDDGRDAIVGGSTIRIANTTEECLQFQVKSSHEHLQMSQTRGQLMAGCEVDITVHPLCRPFGLGDNLSRDWCGSMTVVVGDVLSREVSIVIERSALTILPPFDEVARVRQAISAQTDSFYYTKKVNRRGLYFHARAVECGSCVVGESHQVPVYICNGSDSPMTIFLQSLQEPFSCAYQPTTLHARKFIEVPVTFRPKATGKVATCLVAYSVSGKAAVTLIARGIDRSAATALTHS